ncbi:MAG: radical SAM protein [Brevinematia bacterium]
MSCKVKVFLKKDSISFLFSERYFSSLDYEGRFLVIFTDGKTYRRGFDNTVLCSSVWEINFVLPQEAKTLVNNVYQDIRNTVESGNFELFFKGGSRDLFDYFVNKAKIIDYDFLDQDGNSFRKLFKPITVLPPDQYMSLYLPITEGCSYNKCSFCNLYKDRVFRIKRIDEVRSFTKEVINFLGASLLTRRGVFLGEGNVFVEKTDTLIQSIEVIKEVLISSKYFNFDLNFFGFMDTFHTRKTFDELVLLKDSNVKRVYIGLETGDDFLLSNVLLKPSSSNDVLNVVNMIKEVGINVGLIIMVGIGGKEFKDRHFENTVKLINLLNLSEGDIIYISPFVEYNHLEYYKIVREMGLTRMTNDEINKEVIRFKAELSRLKNVKVPIYRVDKFLYT